MPTSDPFVDLAAIVRRLVDANAVDAVAEALVRGTLHAQSTVAVRAALASGRPVVEAEIAGMQALWESRLPALDRVALASVLRGAEAALAAERQRAPGVELVWTGPPVEGSFVRSTREVLRELIASAQTDVLIVGYWVAATGEAGGVVEELVLTVAAAASRGVGITFVLDERTRDDGRDNRSILLSLWPDGLAIPRLLTWRLPADDRHLKLHAKVVIADERDALVTSANLTSYAMDRNIEMGVRVRERPALHLRRHFALLIAQGILVPYERQGGGE